MEKETRPSFEGTKKEKISPEAEKAEPEAKSAEAKRRREKKLFELMDEAEKAETTPEKTKILREMKEVVGEKKEKELPLERQVTKEEKRKIDEVIERVLKGKLDNSSLLEDEIDPLGEKIVEPFLDKLESLKDSWLKEKPHESYLLIEALEGKVNEKDAEHLASFLLKDSIALSTNYGRKILLLRILGKVGNEKIIDKLVEYSQKAMKTSFKILPLGVAQRRKVRHQIAIKETIQLIGKRIKSRRMDAKKAGAVQEKVELAAGQIHSNIKDISRL